MAAALNPSAVDIKQMILAETHLSTLKCEPGMKTYVYGKAEGEADTKLSGSCLINLAKTWDKIVLAARVIATVEDPSTIYCVGQRPYAQRAIIKFAQHISATPAPGRFTPGQFTNQITQQFVEPRLLIVADPRMDSQAVKEASYVNIPTIAFCGSDSPLEYVDICIPCNNRGKHSLGLMYWLLAREVNRIKGTVPREHEWDVPVDLYFYRDPEEIERNLAEKEAAQYQEEEFVDEYFDEEQYAAPQGQGNALNQQWDPAGAPAGGVPAGGVPAGDQNPNQEWNAGPQAMHGEQTDWAAGYGDQQQQYQQPPAPNAQQPQSNQQFYQQPPQQQYGQQQQQFGGYGQPQQSHQPVQPALDDWDEE